MARVLVVDDSPDLRTLLRVALEGAGHRVVAEADNGAAAIAQATAVGPDAVVLDVMMPGMTGLEALPEIRRQVPGARIVVFSAMGKIDESGGADAYLVKGGPLTALLSALEANA